MKALVSMFWLHNVVFGLASMGPIFDLLLTGGTRGQLNLIPLILAWMAGALMWGLGAVVAGLLPRPNADAGALT